MMTDRVTIPPNKEGLWLLIFMILWGTQFFAWDIGGTLALAGATGTLFFTVTALILDGKVETSAFHLWNGMVLASLMVWGTALRHILDLSNWIEIPGLVVLVGLYSVLMGKLLEKRIAPHARAGHRPRLTSHDNR